MNPLNSVKGAITTAFVLAVIVSVALTVVAGGDIGLHGASAGALLGRWLHIVSGVMWIGLLASLDVVFLTIALWTFEPLMTE
jgi:hypothetical protein